MSTGRGLALLAGFLLLTIPVVVASDEQSREPAVPSALDETIQQVARLLDAQDLAGAKAAADEGLRTFPTSAALHNFAGAIDAQQGTFVSAESHFQTAIKLAPRSPGPYENLGRLYQEHFAVDPDARDKARRTYQALLVVDPGNTEGLYQLALLEALAGQFAESHALVTRLPGDVQRRPQVLAVLAADLAGQNDPRAMKTSAALASHPELSAADVIAVLPAFDRVEDDAVPRQLLEALDRRGMASGDVLQALGRLHARH